MTEMHIPFKVGRTIGDQLIQKLKAALHQSTFLEYVMTNVETNLASANLELMEAYAELVTEKSLRETFMQNIRDEFLLTQKLLTELFDGSMSERRPRMSKTLEIREAPLRVLHHQQIVLLRDWREKIQKGATSQADQLLPKLLLSINAIASGLRTTG